MRKLPHRPAVCNAADLPLFRFAARREDRRRLSYSERFVSRQIGKRPASTVALYAFLAGFKRTEGDDD